MVAIGEEDLRTLSRLIYKIFGFVQGPSQEENTDPSSSPQVHTHTASNVLKHHSPSYRSEVGGLLGR